MIMTISTTREEFALRYLSLFQNALALTERELELFSVIVSKHMDLIDQGLKEPFLSEILFSTKAKKTYCEVLQVSSYNFWNLLRNLKAKGAILEQDGLLFVNTRLIPNSEVTFKFNIV